jgi:hypothetical protein
MEGIAATLAREPEDAQFDSESGMKKKKPLRVQDVISN